MSAAEEGGSVAHRAVMAAMRLAADRPWRELSLDDIAAEAAIGSRELRIVFPCKASLLLGLARQVEDQAAARSILFEASDTERDRLFELLMERFDILAPHRPAIRNIVHDLPRDPLAGVVTMPGVLRIMGEILEAADIPASGPIGFLRAKGLAAIWLATLSVWVQDDSPDSARTMAALDRNLRRVEPFARLLGGTRASRPVSPAPGGF